MNKKMTYDVNQTLERAVHTTVIVLPPHIHTASPFTPELIMHNHQQTAPEDAPEVVARDAANREAELVNAEQRRRNRHKQARIYTAV